MIRRSSTGRRWLALRANERAATSVGTNVARAKLEAYAEYFQLIEGLDPSDGFVGFEVNLSCPNDARRDGIPFALDPDAVTEIMTGCRARTERPLSAKLAPNDPALGTTVKRAEEAGADPTAAAGTAGRALDRAESFLLLLCGRYFQEGINLRLRSFSQSLKGNRKKIGSEKRRLPI